MDRAGVNAICAAFPGAEVSDPWGGGHDAWKVGGKMFACIGAMGQGVSVKTDSVETAQLVIEAGHGIKAPYFHRSWVLLPWGLVEDAAAPELGDLVPQRDDRRLVVALEDHRLAGEEAEPSEALHGKG